MSKYFIYILLIFVISISAASCAAERQDDLPNNSGISVKNKTETIGKDPTEKQNNNSTDDISADEKPNSASETTRDNTASNSSKLGSKEGFEMRCGWYSNPTPGNHWLTDADGQWIIGVQGGHQSKGDYPPEFATSQWLATNGFYGYGCSCLNVKVDKKKMLILEIADGKARPLSACQNDPALKSPDE